MKKLILAITLLTSLQGMSQLIEYQRLRVSATAGGGAQGSSESFFDNAYTALNMNDIDFTLVYSGSVEYRTSFNGNWFVGLQASHYNTDIEVERYSFFDANSDQSNNPDYNYTNGKSKSKVTSVGPMFTKKFKSGKRMSSIYFSFSPFYETTDFEYSTDKDLIMEGKGKGLGFFVQPGADIFITDFIALGYGFRFSYTNMLDVTDTKFKETNATFQFDHRLAMNLFASIRIYY